MMATVRELSADVGVVQACRALDLPRSSYYRQRGEPLPPIQGPKAERINPRALTQPEREAIRDVLNSERFADAAPRTVYATLLDEGEHHCHWRTMYRILDASAEVKERRDQLRHPVYTRPELLATRPRQLWSWDITKLRGPLRLGHFCLYVILDVFSRYVPGWLIADRESEELARLLIADTCDKEGIEPGELTLHADRGAAMIAKSVAQLMGDLGVEPSHSRPHVSDDNPYSEAQFKTLKYCPSFPDRFEDLAAARSFCQTFFEWYNRQHRHSGLAFLTPEMVHTGQGPATLERRRAVLAVAFAKHPERFVHGQPSVADLPNAVWINKPTAKDATTASASPAPGEPPVAQRAATADTTSTSCPTDEPVGPGDLQPIHTPRPVGQKGGAAVRQ